ncbi:RNA methyltransferase [Paenibacillus mesophilus]|uniref:RsmF rRNA methyltransferase first C-terminal domain-containing protein n=1 Tax=Paenibacillus mesophilus TaxID=2582849 RepID=UPI00110D9DD3|nr:RsmF rRNA methyltransferase first C-terminal domain-containing protein [Paenibacillus mesophilus]TMV47806.1 RNA methyltransferase [Paenibacillus mesophilus]
MTTLPQPFIEQIRDQLGEQADPFLQSYDDARTYGLRLNPLKLGELSPDDPFIRSMKERFRLSPVPWCPNGYYYDETAKPGKHPYHQAGLLYIQEPSAMSSAELLDPQPGDCVLDLAAAPGGKTTQIAGSLQGQGLLVANEIHPARAKILSENVERMGVPNAVVTSAAPDALARKFPGAFDKIMLDAPCSGEGMFRKDPNAIREWSPEHVRMCAERQLDILDSAAAMLKPGGTMAYSTCTFNRSENEDVLAAFTAKYPSFTVLRTERLWPHLVRGEGHFVALLRKDGSGETDRSTSGRRGRDRDRGRPSDTSDRTVREAMRLADDLLGEIASGFALPPGEPALFGEQLYWLPAARHDPIYAHDLNGLKTLRPGLHLAHIKKGRAEPAHSLAMAVNAGMCRSVMSMQAESPELDAYLRGETIPAADGASGWTLVTVEGYPLGWGKASGGQLKNHFPKGLRRMG